MDKDKVCSPLGGDNHTCIPGCYLPRQQCVDVGHPWTCSFPPSMLKEALEAQLSHPDMTVRNNEIVVDSRSVTDQLPASIEAFFVKKDSTVSERSVVAKAWREFNAEHRLVGEESAVPLLQLDLTAPSRSVFSVAAEGRHVGT